MRKNWPRITVEPNICSPRSRNTEIKVKVYRGNSKHSNSSMNVTTNAAKNGKNASKASNKPS
jgi:hypothetical protein